MRCKKEIMGLAALMVVLFHFYIPFGNSAFETYMFRSTFIGVDLFFFVSSYSIASRNKREPFSGKAFILNRLELIYAPFVFLAIVAAIYSKWDILRLVKVIFGVEFFERGGGAFLWYFIGIMLIYFLMPLFVLVKNKCKTPGLVVLLVFWLVLSIVLQFVFKYTKAFILVNRLPIFFLGLYYDETIGLLMNKLKKPLQFVVIAMLFTVGSILTYKFSVASRLNKPFGDMYYVVAIPLILATAMLVNFVVILVSDKYKSIILSFIGGITLELYGLQMVFGYDIELFLLKFVPVKQLAFVGTVLILILMAFIFNKLISLTHKTISKITSKTKTA